MTTKSYFDQIFKVDGDKRTDAGGKMYSNLIRAFIVGAIAFGSITMAHAQQSGPAKQSVDGGKYEYGAHCAVCHGSNGAGEGPYSSFLKTVPNLTTLSKRNGGVFPFTRVYETIDGRQVMRAHGPRNMPIWGPRYKFEAGDVDFQSVSEVFVRARILALTEYIYRLQGK
jgi:mono/diheme cytochrome c family protein